MKNYVVKTDNNKGATHALGTLIIIVLLAIPTIGLFYSYDFIEELKDNETIVIASPSTRTITASQRIEIEKKNKERQAFQKKVVTAESIFGESLHWIPGYTAYKNSKDTAYTKLSLVRKGVGNFVAEDLISNNRQDTLKGEDFKTLAFTTYPKNWAEDIIVLQKDIAKGNAWADCIAREEDAPAKINFYKTSYSYTEDNNIHKGFSHEIGHANDWVSKKNLSLRKRINFLLRVWERLNAPDKYPSEYVSSFNFPDSVHYQNWRRTLEYWAVICAQYFSGEINTLNQQDVDLIEYIVLKDDPSYDPITSYWERREIVGGPTLPYKTKEEYYEKRNKIF